MIKNKVLRRLLVLFTVAVLLDHTVTQIGLHWGHEEGNVLVIWIWNTVPLGMHTLALLYILLYNALAIGLHKLHSFLAHWLLIGGIAGHLFGFISWIPIVVLAPIWNNFGYHWGQVILMTAWVIIGAVGAYCIKKK